MTALLLSSASVWFSVFAVPDKAFTILQFTDDLSFSLRLDGAGKIFSCLSATLWPITAVYAFDYMKHEEHHQMFYCFFVMAFGTTMGVAMAENILTMYLFYEMLTLSTIPLVAHGMTKKHNRAARKYMVYSIGGAAFAFAGVAFLIINGADTFRLGGNLITVDNEALAQIIYLFAFMGFGVKSAIFPLHSWLPTASVAQLKAQGINLAFFIPCAILATIIYTVKKQIDYKAILPVIFGGVCGAVVSSVFLKNIPTDYLSKIFAVFLIIMGVSSILRLKKAK